MTDHPPYPYSDGSRAVLGPDVYASADGNTITWQGAIYRRDRGETRCVRDGTDGPSVAECAADDAAHWADKYAGESL